MGCYSYHVNCLSLCELCFVKWSYFLGVIYVDDDYDDDSFGDFNLMNWWWLVELWLVDCMNVSNW